MSWAVRKLPRRLPAQDLDAHHGQRGENDDHEDLAEVVDRGKERQPEQEEEGENRIDDNRVVAQVRREEASHGDLVAAGPCEQAPRR